MKMKNIFFTILAAFLSTGMSYGMKVGKYESIKIKTDNLQTDFLHEGMTLSSVLTATTKYGALIAFGAKLMHMGLSHYPKKWFDVKAGSRDKEGTARWFAYNKTTYNHEFLKTTDNKRKLERAILAITPYAPDAKQINEAFQFGDAQKQFRMKQQYTQTRTMTDFIYRLFPGFLPQGVKQKTVGELLYSLIYVNGKEANELLVQLLEIKQDMVA